MLALLGFRWTCVLRSAFVRAGGRSAWLAGHTSASVNDGFGFLVSGLSLDVKVRRALVRNRPAVGRFALKFAVRRLLGENLVRFLGFNYWLDSDLRDGHVLTLRLLVHEDVGLRSACCSDDRGCIGSIC